MQEVGGTMEGKWGRSKNKSLTSKHRGYSLPALAHILGRGKKKDLQSCV
jgi:hypothetical protein